MFNRKLKKRIKSLEEHLDVVWNPEGDWQSHVDVTSEYSFETRLTNLEKKSDDTKK